MPKHLLRSPVWPQPALPLWTEPLSSPSACSSLFHREVLPEFLPESPSWQSCPLASLARVTLLTSVALGGCRRLRVRLMSVLLAPSTGCHTAGTEPTGAYVNMCIVRLSLPQLLRGTGDSPSLFSPSPSHAPLLAVGRWLLVLILVSQPLFVSPCLQRLEGQAKGTAFQGSPGVLAQRLV